MFGSLSIVLFLSLASQTLADGVVYGHQSSISKPRDWFNFERTLLVNNEEPFYAEDDSSYQDVKFRAKRSAYYPTKSYGQSNQLWQGSGYGQIKSGYRLHCYSIYRTTTDQWCEDNCRLGYCPQSYCACSGGSAGSSYGKYPTKSGSYVSPVYQLKNAQKQQSSNFDNPIVQQQTTEY